MKTIEQQVEEFDREYPYDMGKDMENALTKMLQERDRIAREDVVKQIRNIVHDGKIDQYNSLKSNIEWLCETLTTPLDKE